MIPSRLPESEQIMVSANILTRIIEGHLIEPIDVRNRADITDSILDLNYSTTLNPMTKAGKAKHKL